MAAVFCFQCSGRFYLSIFSARWATNSSIPSPVFALVLNTVIFGFTLLMFSITSSEAVIQVGKEVDLVEQQGVREIDHDGYFTGLSSPSVTEERHARRRRFELRRTYEITDVSMIIRSRH
jgi:hypothetical protein